MRSAHDNYNRDVIGASSLDGENNRTDNMGIPIHSNTHGLHKAWCFNNQFVLVFTCDDGRYLHDIGPSPYREVDNICFTQPGIGILLKNVNHTKAAGPDELPAKILQRTAKKISGLPKMR